MNSFRLATESRRDMALTVAGIIVTAAVFLVLDRLDLSSAAINMVALVGAAMFFSFFVSGGVRRVVGHRYPSARHKWLLSVAFTFLGFYGVARFVVARIGDGPITLIFVLPAGACLAAFLVIDRHDTSVF